MDGHHRVRAGAKLRGQAGDLRRISVGQNYHRDRTSCHETTLTIHTKGGRLELIVRLRSGGN